MSTYTAVLLVDNQPSARRVLRSLGRSRENTLVVSQPDDLRGHTLPYYVRVLDHTDRMSLRNHKKIHEQLKICQATAQRELNDEVIAEFAAELTAVVDDRLQDALHCGEPAALLTTAVLDKLAEQVGEFRNCRLVRRDLAALSERVVADLPERIRTYRRDTTPASVVNQITGPVSGPVAQFGVVHGGIHTPSVAAGVEAAMHVLGNPGVARIGIY